MSAQVLLEAVLATASAVAFVMLFRRVFFTAPVDHGRDWFQVTDVVAGMTFALLLGMLAVTTFALPDVPYDLKTIQSGMVQHLFIILMIGAYLLIRRIPLGAFLGWQKLPLWKVFLIGLGLMVLTAPLIMLIAGLLNPGAGDDQQVVEFFRRHPGQEARWWVAVVAIVAAPISEELLFRGFLYGSFQRYFGKIPSMFFTSVLFAAIHGHLPSLVPLALFAMALTLALELTGSLFVPMAMHAIFNGVTLLILLLQPPQ